MNAQQSKALIEVARKAREALLALDPDSVVALELWSAIHRASQEPAKPASREKCCFCEEAGATIGGFSKKLKLRMAHVACAEAYHDRARRFAEWNTEAHRQAHYLSRDERETLKEQLTYCACGGEAEDHREDRDGNLLECSHCDSCDHFHYQTDRADSPEAA